MTVSDQVRLCLVQPPLPVGVGSQLEHPSQEGEPVATTQSESSGVRGKRIRKAAGVVIHGPDCIGDDLRDGLRILVIGEQIGCDARGPSHRKTATSDPLVVPELASVQADVRPTRLSSSWQRELMDIGREVTNPIDGGR
jgi:hypothetical protein